jgi:Transposase/Transposase IS116/IS110/IS902 family
MLFLGVDWAEVHHDVVLMDGEGRTLARAQVPDGLEGLRRVHELVGAHREDQVPEQVVVGIETERGLLVRGLLSAGYTLDAVNPLAVSRSRERHAVSGAKSDPADAKVLADLVRTDRHNHRPLAPDSESLEAVRVVARAHQGMVWSRQRQLQALRSALREYYPAALVAVPALGAPEALEVLALAPTPQTGRGLSRAKIAGALRRAGRVRRIEERAAEIQAALRAEQPEAPPLVAEAFGRAAAAALAVARTLGEQVLALEAELAERFRQHPAAAIIIGLPGLGPVLGARVLSEFGDAPGRYADARGRKGYAGTAPITKASGRRRVVVARHARNRRLADACFLWAFCSLTQSPGARRYYDGLRARGKTHRQALRQLGNRWVGILHGCRERRETYREEVAWPEPDGTLGLAA